MELFPRKNIKSNGAEINITPLVDVTLVLLIIFMITAPMLFNGIQLTLPKTEKVHKLQLNSKQVVLSVSRTGEYYIGKEKIMLVELLDELKSLLQKNNKEVVYIRADYGLSYGKVAKLMSYLKSRGISNIALVTEIEEKEL